MWAVDSCQWLLVTPRPVKRGASNDIAPLGAESRSERAPTGRASPAWLKRQAIRPAHLLFVIMQDIPNDQRANKAADCQACNPIIRPAVKDASPRPTGNSECSLIGQRLAKQGPVQAPTVTPSSVSLNHGYRVIYEVVAFAVVLLV